MVRGVDSQGCQEVRQDGIRSLCGPKWIRRLSKDSSQWSFTILTDLFISPVSTKKSSENSSQELCVDKLGVVEFQGFNIVLAINPLQYNKLSLAFSSFDT